MNIEYIIDNIKDFLEETSEKYQKSNFKTDVSRRVRYYSLLRDYINSPGASTAEAFFSWYPAQLNLRMEKSPALVRMFYQLTKSKNDASFRLFLDDAASRHEVGEGLVSILRDWIPDDELRVISSSASSDITDSLDILIDMCQDKINNQKQLTDAITSNMPLLLITVLLHYIIFSMLYTSFVSPSILEGTKEFSTLTLIEQRYLQYYWLSQPLNLAFIVGIFAGAIYGLKWSVQNWFEKGNWLREEVFDFLPPWSLSKINQQYQVLMVINNFFKSGASFSEALLHAKKGAPPYVQYQIDKILSNSSVQANEAINIQFFGEMGNIIRERASHIPLQDAIQSLVPTLRQMKKDKFEKTIRISTWVTIKPLAYGSLALALSPVVMYFVDLMSSMQSQLQ